MNNKKRMTKQEFLKKHSFTELDYRNLKRYEKLRQSGQINMNDYLMQMITYNLNGGERLATWIVKEGNYAEFLSILEKEHRREVYRDYMLSNNGGMTVNNGVIVEYNKGWQVCTINSKEVLFDDIEDMLDYIFREGLENFGTWFDDGIWYLDTDSRYYDIYEEAVKAAIEGKQKAIFDWATRTSIYDF